VLTDILQPTHLLIVLVVALLVLGPKRLPAAGRALGQGLREFRSSITGEHEDAHGAAQATIPTSEETTPAP
jgi:sec-independent protein translocase protein TatA